MRNVVIEVRGDRHRLVEDKVVCGCTVCSLRELCEPRKNSRGMCEPFLGYYKYGHFMYGHFIMEDKI